jgi:hypothetical protein
MADEERQFVISEEFAPDEVDEAEENLFRDDTPTSPRDEQLGDVNEKRPRRRRFAFDDSRPLVNAPYKVPGIAIIVFGVTVMLGLGFLISYVATGFTRYVRRTFLCIDKVLQRLECALALSL